MPYGPFECGVSIYNELWKILCSLCRQDIYYLATKNVVRTTNIRDIYKYTQEYNIFVY